MADWTLDLGKIGYTFEGDYDSGTVYPEMTIIKHNGKVWATEEEVATGESPGLTGKWKVWVDGDAVSYPANCIVATDSAGELEVIPNAEGMLTYNPITGFEYLPLPTTGIDTKIDMIPRNSHANYGLSFVTNKGDLKTAGYWGSGVVHNGIGADTTIFTSVGFNGTPTGTIVDVVVTYYNRYVMTSTGEVWSMGANNVGQTGHPTTMGSTIYILTKLPITGAVSMAATGCSAGTSYGTFMVVTSDGKIHSAGYGGYGQTGKGSTGNITTGIQEVPGITNAKSVWGGVEIRYSSFTYLSDEATDNAYSVGYGSRGALGYGSTGSKSTFTKCVSEDGAPISKITKVIHSGSYSSYNAVIMLAEDGKVYTVGTGHSGAGGWGSSSNKNKLYKLPYEGYIDIASCDAYGGSRLMVRGDGKVDFTGYNSYHIAGVPTFSTSLNVPTTITGQHGANIVKVVTNATYNKQVAYFLNSTGEVFHTGDRSGGKTGGAPTAPSKESTKIPLPEPIIDIQVSGNGSNCCVIFRAASGNGYTLGYNGHGELGVGMGSTTIPYASKINL